MHALILRAVRSPWLSIAIVFGAAQPAEAQRARPAGRGRLSLEEVSVMLASSDENEVRTALEGAALIGSREVVPLIDERVRAGLPRVLLDVAIDTLLLLSDRSAGPLLVDLSRHRRPEVRVRALEALGRIKPPTAERTLSDALGDSVPAVRKAAAEGLGELGLPSSVPVLMRALERDVEGAPRALGRTARADDVPRLLEYLDKVSLSTLSPLFTALFARRDLPEAAKLRCVEQLAALDNEEVRAELSAQLTQLPADASPRLRRALTAAAQPGSTKE